MKCLKINVLFLLFIFVCGCQSTQSFKIRTYEYKELHDIKIALHEVKADGNRVIQECYFMNAEKENNWRHQYILYMLDENNEAIPVYNPTNQGINECTAHLKKVEQILKNSTKVRLCVRDKIEKITDGSTLEILDFGALGKHESHYYALTFDTICNSKECYSISDTWIDTCPDFKNLPLIK